MKRRHFSLLEVLIALLLISVTVPLLIAPFFYATLDQQETIDQVALEKAGQSALANIMEQLQFGKLTAVDSDESGQTAINQEWLKGATRGLQVEGVYRFQKLKPKKEDEEESNIELWRVVISLKRSNQKQYTPFGYDFIIQKPALEKPPEEAPAEEPPEEEEPPPRQGKGRQEIEQ